MENNSRVLTLNVALMIEDYISSVLSFLLDIDKDNSKTLSNKSSALSLKTKIDILTDIRALNREEAKKFELFLQIRNQFVHNIKADSFVNCLSFIDGAENRLLRDYPQRKYSKEIQLRLAFSDGLGKDIMKSLDDLLIKLKEKKDSEALNASGLILTKSMGEALKNQTNGLETYNMIMQKAIKYYDDIPAERPYYITLINSK